GPGLRLRQRAVVTPDLKDDCDALAVSEVGFLLGRTVVEIQKNPDGSARVVFERGEKPEPALYADAGWSTYEDGCGKARVLASMVGARVSDASTDGGVLALWFDDGSVLRCEPHP